MDDEKAYLSCCYADPVNIDKGVAAGVTAKHFASPYHRAQWEIILAQRASGQDTDATAVYATALATGRLEAAGGLAAITECSSKDAVLGYNGPAHLSAMLGAYARRETLRLLIRGREMVEKGEDLSLVSDIGNAISAQAAGNVAVSRSTGDLLDEAAAYAQDKWEGKQRGRMISFGLPRLDKYLTPIESHEYLLVCARPSQGKSSILTSIAQKLLAAGGRVVVFTMETTARAVISQIVSQRAQLNLKTMAEWMPNHIAAFKREMAILKEQSGRLLIFDKETTLAGIESRCRMLAASFKPDLVVLDYLGLIQAEGKSPYERVSRVSKAMIPLRKQLNCALIAGQQLNNNSAKEDREPGPHDLRDSGQLAEDSHRIVMLHWTDSHNLDSGVRQYRFLQPKLRDGPVTAVNDIKFNCATTTFYDS